MKYGEDRHLLSSVHLLPGIRQALLLLFQFNAGNVETSKSASRCNESCELRCRLVVTALATHHRGASGISAAALFRRCRRWSPSQRWLKIQVEVTISRRGERKGTVCTQGSRPFQLHRQLVHQAVSHGPKTTCPTRPAVKTDKREGDRRSGSRRHRFQAADALCFIDRYASDPRVCRRTARKLPNLRNCTPDGHRLVSQVCLNILRAVRLFCSS